MTISWTDMLGLNATPLAGLPVIASEALAKATLGSADKAKQGFALVGSGHSQGGHTVCEGGISGLTEPMNRVLKHGASVVFQVAGEHFITVEAGATWNVLHAHLAPLGFAPLVHQSSPHFTVGGSLSVNCHGRDPRQGPLSTTVHSIEVLLPNGQVATASPGDAVFKAVVGGYGSARMVLRATLKLTPNIELAQSAQEMSLDQYAQELQKRHDANNWPHLHHGWLNFSSSRLLETVLSVDCQPTQNTQALQEPTLGQDAWVGMEAMRWLWEQHGAQRNAKRDAIWTALNAWFTSQNGTATAPGKTTPGKTQSRTAWLRQSTGFTVRGAKGISTLPATVDMLWEFFVPLPAFQAFVLALKPILKHHQVNLLSSSVRVVQPDQQMDGSVLTHLSYCPTQTMVSIALDFAAVADKNNKGVLEPVAAAGLWVREATDAALELGGSYYLPYYAFATVDQMHLAYPKWLAQKAARLTPFNSRFIAQYL